VAKETQAIYGSMRYAAILLTRRNIVVVAMITANRITISTTAKKRSCQEKKISVQKALRIS